MLIPNFYHLFFFRYRSRVERSLLIVPGTPWCGDDHNADTYTQLGGLSTLDKCCRRHDHCKRNIPSSIRKYHYLNLRPFTLSLCRGATAGRRSGSLSLVFIWWCASRGQIERAELWILRSKRDISDIFRVPGTKWCGKGYSADKYTRLGGFSRTDRCCRRHDLSCPFWIGGFSTKYGLFN
ncbi:hypothetical protein NQ317_013412 [Molorchus minor]|uniref:phospholipase A2 n=1 Tax=Molorchus minor TaxID=1323400 RepID=A0ABQ9JUL2_9CUCU|nr:hypothetical protein NQ317_013412 [Molorchus minor]